MATSFTQIPALQINSSGQNRFMKKLMAKIFSFYDEQSLIDVTFRVSNPTALVPAHRLILAAASPYFENLFNSDQSNNPVIEINDIDSDTFERLITFCYTGQTLVTVNNVGAMLKAAIVLKLDDAITSCVDYLMAHINEYSLQGVYTLERETQCERLMQKIIEHETQNFVKISQSDEFLNFDVEKMQRILELDNLNIFREEKAFAALKRWFNHDVPARQEQLPLLIACLRLTEFDANFLLTHIQPLPGCEMLAFKAMLWIRDPAARAKINMRFTGPRNFSKKTLLAVCSKEFGINPKLLQYNKAKNMWQEYASIEIGYGSYRTILKDDNLLFLGGWKTDAALKIVRSWNIRNKAWQSLPALDTARWEHCVVELDGKIYAIGGSADTCKRVLASVERYTTSDGWEYVKSLIVGRSGASAVTLNGKIYIMGGITDCEDLKSVECYNPDSNTWTPCADMIESHHFAGAAAHNGHIYVLGRNYGNGKYIFKGMIGMVERYDPQQDTWSKICSLPDNYCYKCVSLDNKLWAIGDCRVGNIFDKKCVSVYDEENDRWEEKCSLFESRIHSCFVVPEALLTSK